MTCGAGGSSADTTTEIVRTAHEQLGLETCMHLTCTNMPAEQVHRALVDAKEHGCENILALRGDPPKGEEEWSKTEGGFEHAIDLIRYIRKHFGNHFDIAIAGFPEGHPHARSKEEELQHVKAKVDAGANFIITQMFYDADGRSLLDVSARICSEPILQCSSTGQEVCETSASTSQSYLALCQSKATPPSSVELLSPRLSSPNPSWTRLSP